jgi:hypothetical protein
MFTNVGVAASSAVTSSLLFVFSFLFTILLHMMGKKWRNGG